MKIFIGVMIFTCLAAFPVFSQDTDAERYKALSDSMGSSVSRSTDRLANYDSMSGDDGSLRTYSLYRKRHDELVSALRESEIKLDRLFRTNDRTRFIKQERDNYERLLVELQSVKSEYDAWLSTVN